MKTIETHGPIAAETIFSAWLEKFGAAIEEGNAPALMEFFADDSYWKDYLSFTWEHRTFAGLQQIREAFEATKEQVRPRAFRVASGRAAPHLRRRSGKNVLEAFFDFETRFGKGTGFVRLLHKPDDPTNPRVWLMLTSLQQLHEFHEQVGPQRPTGDKYAKNTTPENWRDDRIRQVAFEDRDPEVLIVGAGHAGLILAARLGQFQVDTLVIDKAPRVGDNWRNRYHSLTLHNESMANHMPYLSFPDTWPVWLPKDRLADWLESYASALDVNVWTGTELTGAWYDGQTKTWTASLRRSDGTERQMKCKHLVVAIGVSGSIPHMPDIPGLKEFAGEVKHSSQYKSGKFYKDKNAIVIGTGNSAHDVAQDLYLNGAKKVWMFQRSPTCVVSLDPSAKMVYNVYSEGPPVDDIDLMTGAIPYPVLEDTYKFMTRRHAELDKDLTQRLNRAGFETYYGRDDTGFHMMYLRGEGGYYIDVGCSELIADGKVGVIQARDTDCFVRDGLRMKNGEVVPCDLVVLATGFKNMQEGIRQLVGDEIADRVGPIWGFDEDNQMRGMWRRTAQDGFWVMGGGLIDARLHSRFMAIEIKAALEGILPERSEMPWVKHFQQGDKE